MTRRTTPGDAERVVEAADLEELVVDKRETWRASGAKARRRQRRYQHLLTMQLTKLNPRAAVPEGTAAGHDAGHDEGASVSEPSARP